MVLPSRRLVWFGGCVLALSQPKEDVLKGHGKWFQLEQSPSLSHSKTRNCFPNVETERTFDENRVGIGGR